jgi:HPr kinase/phosphorylase
MSAPPVHASCVVRFGRGVLIRGASGAGKSSLALQLILQGFMLVGDDYVDLRTDGNQVVASAPDRLRGLLEIYGLGITHVPVRLSAAIALIVDLVPDAVVRLPEPRLEKLLNCAIPALDVPKKHDLASFMVLEALRLRPIWG